MSNEVAKENKRNPFKRVLKNLFMKTKLGKMLNENNVRLDELTERMNNVQGQLTVAAEDWGTLAERVANDDLTIRAVKREVSAAIGGWDSLAERMASDDMTTSAIIKDIEYIKTVSRGYANQLNAEKARSNKSNTSVNKATEENIDALFYHDFEERFRGSQNDVRARIRDYIPIFKEHFGEISDKSFVDIGCGRGEWLDVLKEHGVEKRIGVDINDLQLEFCVSKGHNVASADCVDYLSGCDAESIDVVTGFQLIEHLPLGALITLLDACFKVLKPGGMVLFETPNSGNLQTGASLFYIDPTHKRPIHQLFADFLLSRSGFRKVEIILSSPLGEEFRLEKPINGDNLELWRTNLEKINSLLYGPQDYAVIGVKEMI